MRSLAAFALLLCACGGPSVAPGGTDGGVDAGATSGWGGVYDLGNQSTTLQCDGGGTMEYVGFLNSGATQEAFVDVDGGIRIHSALGPFIAIDRDGRVHSDRLEGSQGDSPAHTGATPYTVITGQFMRSPTRFVGSASIDAWHEQCHGSFASTWTALDGGP